MTEDQDIPSWPGLLCDTDAWPYSSDVKVFEARKAAGQLVRTGLTPPGLDDADVDPALGYIYAVKVLRAALKDIQKDIVAEARTRKVTWQQIGLAYGTTAQGAWNDFHDGISTERLARLREEALISAAAAEVATPHELPQGIAANLDGATPADRMNYLARQALETSIEIGKLLSPDEPACEDMLEALRAAGRKVRRVGKLVTADHAMWAAVAARTGRPEDIDQANYYAPATYLLHVMRLLMLAWARVPGEECEDIDEYRASLAEVSRIYANVVFTLERADVGSVVPCQCGGTWNRCDGTCVPRR